MVIKFLNSRIAFNVPYCSRKSLKLVKQVVKSRKFSGAGKFTLIAESMISELVGGGKVIFTPSCTDALNMISLILNFGPGDEVIMPSFNFTSSAISTVNYGARAVFVDIDRDSKCLDLNLVESAITERTKAIVIINYAGFSEQLIQLKSLCTKFGIILVEDNAHGLGASHQGITLGSVGDFSVLSFHDTKNVHCGEGGALVINNKEFEEIALSVRDKGSNRQKFLNGQVDKYTWISKGGSHLGSELSAAFLVGQLKDISKINRKRIEISQYYRKELHVWAKTNGIEFPPHRVMDEPVGHIFYLVCHNIDQRNQIIQHARDRNIELTFHYQALHDSPAGKKYGTISGDCIVSREMSECLIRLPISYEMKRWEMKRVVESIKSSL